MTAHWVEADQAARLDALYAAARDLVAREGDADAYRRLRACVRDCGGVTRWREAEVVLREVVP